ncbi:hypothetical protein QTO34_016527 [Cnephaeus nilssonii]|uniref:Uncharacterized protein n=1 Tax=Cnephaeus nilssonii TaxID=3371016 RepID=A0AA40I2E1_CNENI|nr:hypothetical protein QTO34_016527 [Eptesicus nilssonii]
MPLGPGEAVTLGPAETKPEGVGPALPPFVHHPELRVRHPSERFIDSDGVCWSHLGRSRFADRFAVSTQVFSEDSFDFKKEIPSGILMLLPQNCSLCWATQSLHDHLSLEKQKNKYYLMLRETLPFILLPAPCSLGPEDNLETIGITTTLFSAPVI